MKKFFCILISLLIVMSSIISAQNIKKISKAGNVNRFTQVPAPQVYLYRNQLNKVVTTNFLVTYETNVPSEARTAFDKAVEIWSYLIVLSKPVKIKVKFVNDPNSGMLGGTGIPTWRNNFSNVPIFDRQCPISLAKHLDNSINYTEYDIEMEFNGANSFNYSIDGIPIADHFDFVTVALHEIGHGLGLFGSFDVQQNEGYFGYNGYPVFTTNTYPTIADQFYLNGSTRLINVTSSSMLGGLLQNNNVWYDGINAKNANNNQNIKMFAPLVWEPGSSIDHLDEITFPAGNLNSLMTPTLDPAEVNHNPGPIFLGMLKDYGHTVGRIITFTAPLSNNNIVKGQNFNITWHDNISGFGDYINFDLYKITTGEPLLIESINGNNYVFSNPGTQGNSYSWSVPTTLENNFYFIRAEGSNHLVDYGQSQIFTISNIPEAPKFNPPGGQYSTPQWVSLYTNSPVSEIRYTLNGTEPNETSTLFTPTSPIYIDASKTIRAKSILVLPNGTKVLSPSSDATYFIGSNSFVKGFTSPYYGYYGRNGSFDNYSTLDGLNIGKAQSNYIYRSFVDWNNIRTQIPSGSIIQSVEIVLPLEPSTTPASIEFREFTSAPYWQDNWDNIGNGALISTMNANLQVFNVGGLVSKVQSIVNGVGSDVVRIGIKNANENEYSHFVQFPWNNPVLRVYYRGNVEISQLDKDDQPFGQVGYWNGSVWENKNVPATVFKSGSITLKSYQGYKENTTQKYYNWLDQPDIVNHTNIGISSGVNFFTSKFNEANLNPKVKNFYTESSNLNPSTDKIWIKDPWLIDEMDGQYGLRNQGIGGGTTGSPGADWYQLDSPIDFSDPIVSNYKGVFLDQGAPDWTPPYYSVKVDQYQDIPLTQTGKTHRFYFQNWSGTNVNFQNSNALETPVVFTLGGATAQANLKGTGLSSNSDTYTNNGQSKTIRTPDGANTLHRVYESLGHVWYETSTDNGQSWVLMNGGHPLDNGGGKSPSIDYAVINTHNLVVIVYQENHVNSLTVKAAVYKSLWGDFPFQHLETEEIFFQSYIDNANPVISIPKIGTTVIVWQVTGNGLYYRNAGLHETGLNLTGSNTKLTGTNGFSKNPSISCPKTPNSNVSHLVWEENNAIKHFTFNSSPPGTITTISSGDGYTYNNRPSVITLGDGYGRVCWVGSRYDEEDSDNPTMETRTIFRGTNNNHFWAFGNTVISPNIKNSDDESYYAIAWSEGDGTSTKFADNTLSTVRNLNIAGSNIQVSNGTTKNQMYADVFKSAAQPYYFQMSNNLGSYYSPQKTNSYKFASGREGVIYQDTAQFYFTVGDILVDEQAIDFIAIPDSIELNTKEILNTYLVSDPFQLNDNSLFLYSIKYGATDSSAAVSLLSNTNKYISFKLRLVDAQSLEVLGNYDEIIFDQSNIFMYNNLSYQVNTEGIGNKTVFLRLQVEDNFSPDYSLSQIYSDNDILEKRSLQTINFTGSEIPVTYDLAQNFPNPFNRNTTIRYQLPQDGIVTLKIYDILGAEVATLVNQEKLAGKYEVNFNASSLASGVYIYKIQAGSFINSKKMILLK